MASFDQEHAVFARQLPNIGEHGMARLLPLLALDGDWLSRQTMFSASSIPRLEQALAGREAAIARVRLLAIDFSRQAYANPDADLNRLFWSMCTQYLHVAAEESIQPWAADIDAVLNPVAALQHLGGDLVAAQTLHYLKSRYGSPYGNPVISAYLVHTFYRFGGRYPWQELLERGTDEVLNPAYLFQASTD
jgi:hypothetical protein